MADLTSKIILVKDINIDRDYLNVLSYSESQMLNLCQTNAIASSTKYSFIRNTGKIYTDFTYEQCLRANYIAFQNPDYSNKWFFAFIDDVQYKGEKNTEITYTVDAWSTWFDKWQKKNCYVVRHHVNDDVIGNYTLAENIDIGDVYQESETIETSLNEFYRYAVLSSYNPLATVSTMKQFGGITMYNGQIFGKWVFLFPDVRALSLYIYHCNKDGHINDIQDMFYVPNAIITDSDLIQYSGSVEANNTTENYSYWGLQYSDDIESFNLTINKRHSFTGYTPKNNKCFVYPYNYILATNNNGNTNIYKYEDFSGANCVFRFEGCLSVGCSIQCVPLNYKNMSRNDDEGIPVPKYPTIAWSSDAFTNWLTQNGVNMQTGLLTNILGMAISALGTVAGGSATSSSTASSSASNGAMVSMGGNMLTSVARNGFINDWLN